MREIILRQKQEKEQVLKTAFVDREVSKKIEKYLQSDIIKVVSGIRRCGKSVLCFMALRNKGFAYVNFDEKELTEAKNYDEILKYIKEFYGDVKYLLLDEIQNLPQWELWANSLKRRGYNLLMTGSNAKLLSTELATHLTGRHVSVEMFPFSFKEFLQASGFEFKKEYTQEEMGEILNRLKKYLETGGFPEVVVKGYDYSYLQSLFDSIIFKDIVKRYRIKYSDALYNLAKYLLSGFAQEASFTYLKNVLHFRSVHTVQNYVRYLEETYLIFSIGRFSFKQHERITSQKKIYAIDTGMIYALAFQSSGNYGRLMENVVAIELLRRRSNEGAKTGIDYYKDYFGKEVDFVITEGMTVRQLIQVCYDVENADTKEREIRSLLKASDDLRCKNLLIITWDSEGKESARGKKIIYMPLWKWLLTEGGE
ncbi:MAG: ATP-binding protein [Candidatus Aenigmarchaeota archaeon]|nr:ATP-binding protein [Candidatus Aenigmarchaeota archaeon]